MLLALAVPDLVRASDENDLTAAKPCDPGVTGPCAGSGAPMRSREGVAGAAGFPGEILVPVAGVARDQLRDSFQQPRSGGRTHRALDILAPMGTPVVAAVDGTIRKLFFSKAGGISIYQFDPDEERVFYYAHLQRYADGLAEGQVVKRGTVIGYVGVSGNAPKDTPHLHFAIETLTPEKVWWKGTPLNPYPLLTARAGL